MAVEEFSDPAALPEDELLKLYAAYAAEHASLCLRRWVLFDQIDVMRAERVRRLRDRPPRTPTATPPPRKRLFTGTGVVEAAGDDLPPPAVLPDLTTLDDEALHARLRAMKSIEDDVSLRRQIVWQRLKVLSAELRDRGLDPDEL